MNRGEMRILLAEDDRLLGSAVYKALTRSGYAVDWVENGGDFEHALVTHHYDFIVLDLGLPDQSGEMLLRHVRVKRPNLPVIVVTARGGVHDRISLLDLGADDYLVKPYDLDELIARIRSVLRRAVVGDGDEGAQVHGSLRILPNRHCATWNGETVALTHREFCVLEILVRKRNQVVSRAQLEESLYGWGEEVDSNAIEVYVHFLRRKLGAGVIHTVRGVGYQLAAAREHV